MKFFTALLGISFLTACGGESSTSTSTNRVFTYDYSVVSGTPTITENSLSGSATVSFGSQLISTRSEESNFYFEFKFTQDTGFLAIHSFADANLANAQIVTFTKKSPTELVATYTSKNSTTSKLEELEQSLDVNIEPLSISIEVHNGEDNGSHVITWVGDELEVEPFEVLDGIYGASTNLGLNFENVEITKFEVGPAEALDE